MWIGVITLMPELFDGFSTHGVAGRELDCHFFNPRDYTQRKHGQIDDKPYGGGPGMVMQVEPLEAALAAAQESSPTAAATTLVVPTPQGKPLTQEVVWQLAKENALIFLCGRYEGIDERVLDKYVDERDARPGDKVGRLLEVSLGDFVLTGGELPAQVILDALSRWLPGTLGNAESADSDSFANGLLESPAYTRPEVLPDGRRVPDALTSGDHQRIARYRRKQSLKRTLSRRPELVLQTALSDLDRELLKELFIEQAEEPAKDQSK